MSSVRVKTGSQKEIQVVSLIKLELNAPVNVFLPPEWGVGEVAGIPWGLDSQNSHCLWEFDRRLWHRGGTLDVSARKLMKLCLNLKARPGVF